MLASTFVRLPYKILSQYQDIFEYRNARAASHPSKLTSVYILCKFGRLGNVLTHFLVLFWYQRGRCSTSSLMMPWLSYFTKNNVYNFEISICLLLPRPICSVLFKSQDLKDSWRKFILLNACFGVWIVPTGGRDRRGGPVLTFPARSNHDRIRPEDLRRLIAYLATIPR